MIAILFYTYSIEKASSLFAAERRDADEAL